MYTLVYLIYVYVCTYTCMWNVWWADRRAASQEFGDYLGLRPIEFHRRESDRLDVYASRSVRINSRPLRGRIYYV